MTSLSSHFPAARLNSPDSISSLTSMDILPSELLLEIFGYCSVNEPLAPLLLSKVAHWWKGLIAASPRVWQTITLSDHRPLQSSWSQASLFVNLSQPLTFDIFLAVEDPNLILPLLSPLFPSIDRWRSFTILGGDTDLPPLPITPSLLGPKPLERLDLAIDSANPDPNRPPFAYGEDHFWTSITVTQLPPASMLMPLRFTILTMTERSLNIQSMPAEVLSFLAAVPTLEAFYYRGWKLDVGPIDDPLPVAYLPRLHTLDIGSTCSIRAILSSLDVPRLERLYLSDINVDFELHSPEVHEEGDYEDEEERDFSQSPSSDHATGMGLRKLISRCHPPLRILEMHYSDMRTTDFIYLFSRSFHHLEEFRIVASDMSETVLNLLRPTPTLLLPRLRLLELQNCQRLSADSILSTLSSRVQFIERENPKGVVKMKRIGIVECGSFTGGHVERLRKAMGRGVLRWV